MGKHAHNCITQCFESRLAPHASNAQGGPLCKRGGCVRTLRTPPAYGLGCASIITRPFTFTISTFRMKLHLTKNRSLPNSQNHVHCCLLQDIQHMQKVVPAFERCNLHCCVFLNGFLILLMHCIFFLGREES